MIILNYLFLVVGYVMNGIIVNSEVQGRIMLIASSISNIIEAVC